MPTELPTPKAAPPKSTTSGTLATVAAVLLMVILSYTTLRQGDDGLPVGTPQFQGL